MFSDHLKHLHPIETPSQHNFDTTVKGDKRFDLMQQIVEKDGLQGLHDHVDKKELGIGIDFFPSMSDFIELASYDKEFKELNPTIDNHTLLVNHENKQLLYNTPTTQKHPEVLEGNGEGMDYVINTPFESWEGTIHKNPQITFIPKTKIGLKNLIQWAEKEDLRVRASGYRHSSSEMYSDDNQIFVSTLDLYTVTHLPAQYPKMNPENEMQGIKLVGSPYLENGKYKINCQIGGSTCNYHIQDWVHDANGGNWAYTLPLNVIMSEITFAGSNAPMCHGAGIHNKTLSDLVTEIEFVNVKGNLQRVNDKDQIKAAAGCFGLLGIVTAITVKLDEMSYANFETVEKKLLALTIPPPKEMLDSSNLKNHLSKSNLKAFKNPEKLDQAMQAFIKNCEDSYYSEFFWFPLQEKAWINCWKNNGNKSQAVRYPDSTTTNIQRLGSYLAYLATTTIHDKCQTPLLRKIQTKIMGDLAMLMMPDKPKTVCSVHDAIHFRKGIQNFRTRMMEMEIPIPNISGTNKPDWSICQKAWWSVIESTYSEKNMTEFPIRTTFEMRIMGGSDVLMAAQHGNERTCAIEILTPLSVDEQKWNAFMQEILDNWAMLKNDKGEYLNIRPHWAKSFDNLYINRDKSWINEWSDEQKFKLYKYVKPDSDVVSIPIRIYLNTIAYKEQIPNFKKQIKAICQQGGYEFDDIKKRFSNVFLDELMSPNFKPNLSHQVNTIFSKKPETLCEIQQNDNTIKTKNDFKYV